MADNLWSLDLKNRIEEVEDESSMIEQQIDALRLAPSTAYSQITIGYLINAIRELIDEKSEIEQAAEYISDWDHGATLIHEDNFVDYVMDLCVDIGDIPRELPDYIEIDWQATANNISVDYTEVEINGMNYLVR